MAAAAEKSAEEKQEKKKESCTQTVERLEKALEAEKARADEMTVAAQRLQADFDNYRKRNAEAVRAARKDGQCDVIESVLPVLDVFESALAMITDTAVAQGVKMVQRQFLDTLNKLGVEQIPALGEDFDPEFHDAIEHVESDTESDSGKVVEVMRQGYRLSGKVLRHSMVKVGK